MKDLKKLTEQFKGVFYNKETHEYLTLEIGDNYLISENKITNCGANIIKLSEGLNLPYYSLHEYFSNLELDVKKEVIVSSNTNIDLNISLSNLIKVGSLDTFNQVYKNTITNLVDSVNRITLGRPALSKSRKLVMGGRSTPFIVSLPQTYGRWKDEIFITLSNDYILRLYGDRYGGGLNITNLDIIEKFPDIDIKKSDNIYLLSDLDLKDIMQSLNEFNCLFSTPLP